MTGKTDVVKGRIKEAMGALANDDKLREEGKTDQQSGKVKQAKAARKTADKAEETAECARVAAEKAADEAKG